MRSKRWWTCLLDDHWAQSTPLPAADQIKALIVPVVVSLLWHSSIRVVCQPWGSEERPAELTPSCHLQIHTNRGISNRDSKKEEKTVYCSPSKRQSCYFSAASLSHLKKRKHEIKCVCTFYHVCYRLLKIAGSGVFNILLSSVLLLGQ